MYLVHLTTLLVFPAHQNYSAVVVNTAKFLQTVPLRRNLTGYMNVNRYKTDTERVRECEQNRYRMDTAWISSGYKTVTDPKRGKKAFSRTQTIREHVLQNTPF